MSMTKFIVRASFVMSKGLLAITICLLALGSGVFGQSSATDGATPAGYTAGAPAGSYPLSGFDTINFFNGNLNFNLPFLQVKGRGGSGHSFGLKIERKWRKMKVTNAPYAVGSGGWQSIQAGYGAGALEGRVAGMEVFCDGGWGAMTLLRLTFTAPDGTEFELRDALTGGAPGWTEYNSSCQLQTTMSRGKVFVTADGSSATFISDIPLFDANSDGPTPTGYLFLRDGTRFRIVMGKVTQMRDRNGNLTTYNFTDGRLSSVVDSLGRSVTISYHAYGTGYDTIVYKGSNGTPRTIKVWYTTLGSALRSGYSLQTYRQLFPELSGTSTTTQFNPEVVSSLQLPDGRSYSFQYNSYGELARVVLPTGGAFEYDWGGGLSGGTSSGVLLNADGNIYRRLVEKRIYDTGGSGSSYTSRMTVSKPEDASSNNLGYVVVEQRNSSGTLLTKEVHYYYGSARASFLQDELDFSKWKEGKEWKTELFASNGTTVLRRVEHTWQQPSSTTTWPLTQAETSDNVGANDPQITQTVATLVDTNQVSKQTFAYDKYSNKTDVYEFDYGSGAPAASWLRRSHTDFLTTNSINSLAYDTINPSTSSPNLSSTYHLRSLPTQTQVFDAGGTEKSRTTFEFDYYVGSGPRAELVPRINISGLDSASNIGYLARGNVTRSTTWILSTGTQVHSYPQYDIAGNVVKTTDPLGNPTDFFFDDRFGSADGEAQGNSPPSELGANKSFAFVTKVRNAANHITHTQYDYYLGRVVDFEDANGVTSSGYFDDALDRPTKIIRGANHASVKNQTLFAYNDADRTITTTSDLHTNTDGVLINKLVYDSLGRTIETRQYEGTKYIATQQQYDALGRVFKTSNPFRPLPPDSETPVWTQTAFDSLGRVTTVTTPDSAVVSTSYSSNTVTVTDQAGKKRRSVTDGLGRLVRVDEPDGNNNLDLGGSPVQPTNYSYDVLDNLTTVTQGTLTRIFLYDSLKRLISASYPESETICYGRIIAAQCQADGYDANGNLIYKTDGRGVLATYGYDVLNRNTSIDYSDATPDVYRQYDLATYGKGRLNQTSQGGSTTSATYIDSYDALGRPLVQRQKFETGGVWSESYQVSRNYNLAGGVISETYPSNRTVTYTYDNAGRTDSLTGYLGDGINRTYATGIKYSPWGGLSREQFGTDIPLYHRQHYTNRGQLFDMRVATTDDGSWNRGAIINYYSLANFGFGNTGTDTNGNVYAQQHWIFHNDQMTAWTVHQQNYAYDSLNRISWVGEYLNGATHTGSQYFAYDRWGNRRIDPATWGTGINNKQFTVDPANNNRLAVPSGQSGVMTFDAAGNLINDTYSGNGSQVYDAENRMTSAQGINQGAWQYYSYNADGQRVRRKVDGVETWQIYGMAGELLAEYAASAAATNPQKEYGYRNGQLLVTAESAAQIKWLVADHLGTPRMIFDKSGSLPNVKRHDYLPFGEELFAGVGGRTPLNGYSVNNVRQKFTSKERDKETGLDYFLARYNSNIQGRFTSIDPLMESADPLIPQSWNRYSYVLNNPLAFIDPTGEIWVRSGSGDVVWFSEERWNEEISKLKDSKGNPAYTPLGPSEMEFNTNFGRVKLNPDGPDADAEPGSDAYLGFSIVGGNKTDFSVAVAAGLAIGMRGRHPMVMAGAATVTTIWILTNPVRQGLPIVDNNIYSQSKHNKEVIEGLIGTAVDHIEKVKNNPGSRDVGHWKKEIKAALDRVKNIAERLKGKTKEAVKEKVRELEKQAESP